MIRQCSLPLPEKYLIETECVGGTGHGDEQFLPTLKRWETRTTGKLWWKKTVTAFFPVKQFESWSPRENIVEYAWIHQGVAE